MKTEQDNDWNSFEKGSVSDGSITLCNHEEGYEIKSLSTPMHGNFKVLPENESGPQTKIEHYEAGKLKMSQHDNLNSLSGDSKQFSSEKSNVTVPKMKSH